MVVYSGIWHAPPFVECSSIEKPPWLQLEADGYVNPSPKWPRGRAPFDEGDGVLVISPQEYVCRLSNIHESALTLIQPPVAKAICACIALSKSFVIFIGIGDYRA